MTFGQALDLCLAGRKITKKENKDGTYIALGKCENGHPCLIAYNSGVKPLRNWTPTTEQMLSSDWQTIDSEEVIETT